MNEQILSFMIFGGDKGRLSQGPILYVRNSKRTKFKDEDYIPKNVAIATASVINATGFESYTHEIGSSPKFYGGSVYTKPRFTDREYVLTVRPEDPSICRDVLSSISGSSDTSMSTLIVTTNKGSFYTYGYISGISGSLFSKSKDLQIVFKSPDSYLSSTQETNCLFDRESFSITRPSTADFVNTISPIKLVFRLPKSLLPKMGTLTLSSKNGYKASITMTQSGLDTYSRLSHYDVLIGYDSFSRSFKVYTSTIIQSDDPKFSIKIDNGWPEVLSTATTAKGVSESIILVDVNQEVKDHLSLVSGVYRRRVMGF